MAYISTITTESLVIYALSIWGSRHFKNQIKRIIKVKDYILIGVIPTTLTIPYLWFVWPFIVTQRIPYIISGEILVTLIEALLIKLLSRNSLKVSIGFSIIANICSFSLGLIKKLIFGNY